MKEYTFLYRETYEGEYTVRANSREEAEEILRDDILEGRREGPDECVDSGFNMIAEEVVE